MNSVEKKKELRCLYLKPKDKLKELRILNRWTTTYTASLIGLERRQYELKEKGVYPFNDYEMIILAEAMNSKISDLFF